MQLRSLSSYICVVGADAATLARVRPQPHVLLRGLAAPHAWVQSVGADAAAATLAETGLWLVAAWLAVGLTAGALAAIPGAVGRRAALVTRALLPGILHRMVVGASGAGLILAPVAGVTAFAAGGVAYAATSSDAVTSSLPTPVWPTTAAEVTAPHRATPTRAPKVSTPAGVVTVRPGDSLWKIAAEHLGRSAQDASITTTWRRIYRANRVVIGSDPALIRPGQQLRVDPATNS